MKSIPDIQFREASSADAESMAQCHTSDPSNPVADPRIAGYLDGQHHPQQALPARVGYLAIIDHEIVGYITGHRTTRHGCEGEVQDLFVAPEYRRRGIATALLRMLAQWYREQNAVKVCVALADDSPKEAKPFYESLGARPLKRYWHAWEDISKAIH